MVRVLKAPNECKERDQLRLACIIPFQVSDQVSLLARSARPESDPSGSIARKVQGIDVLTKFKSYMTLALMINTWNQGYQIQAFVQKYRYSLCCVRLKQEAVSQFVQRGEHSNLGSSFTPPQVLFPLSHKLPPSFKCPFSSRTFEGKVLGL